MGLKEDVVTAAANILKTDSEGMTGEALGREIGRRIGRQLPPKQVMMALQGAPQRFTEGGDGRWRLRARLGVDVVDIDRGNETGGRKEETRAKLRQGCYVVFDLEATGQGPEEATTEIIQIAACRFVDGRPQQPWATFVCPSSGAVPAHITALTGISTDAIRDAPSAVDALRALFIYTGDLPLVAHNGASYDGPLVAAVCARLGLPLPDSFLVLDTLPLARVLLPLHAAHTVSALAEHYGCARPDAHLADADVEMLSGIIAGLQRDLRADPSGAAVYDLLRRADDPWADVLRAPEHTATVEEIVATFGAQLTPPLPERGSPGHAPPLDAQAVDDAFATAEAHGRARRDAQIEMAHLVADTLRDEGYAAIEAGTGTGKSSGYLIPAAIAARADGRPIAVSTFTRILQNQLVERELPFVRELIPEVTYAQLQGRRNYLSLSRLVEELDDALSEDRLAPARAWILAALVRFAAESAHGNLDGELGYIPQSLEESLHANGSVLQLLNSVRASVDDHDAPPSLPDFYRRARENAERADIVVVNHALLLNVMLKSSDDAANQDGATGDEPFTSRVVCDEAHTLEDAATLALEQRVEERVLRRLLRAIHNPPARAGLTITCRRTLGLKADNPSLIALIDAVDGAHAALDGLTDQLRRYVTHRTVVSRDDLERYGVRVRIDRGVLSAAGGPALRAAAESMAEALATLQGTLAGLLPELTGTPLEQPKAYSATRHRRVVRLARALLRDLREVVDNYHWFWSFRDEGAFVRVVDIGRIDAKASAGRETEAQEGGKALGPIAISGVPINVGPALWQRVWSRLDAAIYTSATLTVFGQGFDFFLGRVGLEPSRVQASTPDRGVVTRELPHAFDYHEHALLMLPNDLPSPRDSALKRAFPEAVADLLRRFIPFFGGKTLTLFMANSRRDMVYDLIAPPLAEEGFPVSRQGQGSLPRLIDEFRADPTRSLLGSRSLWEGVDVAGPSLSFVFLEKLPYPSIGDPVEAARMGAVEAAGGDPFYRYLLPKMVMLLKQGFGRLIRSPDDHGVAILLDKRLRSAMYRTEVLRSLPDPTIGYESDTDMFQHIAEWMGLPFDPDDCLTSTRIAADDI